MDKNLYISVLLDFYENILTKKQREVVKLYYNEDLSLSEISEHVGITRQGVRDSIKRGEKILLEAEEKIGMEKYYSQVYASLDKILEETEKIVDESSLEKINVSVQKIREISILLQEFK